MLRSQLFASNITSALHNNLQRDLGIEQTAATLTSFFLDGARRRPADDLAFRRRPR